MENEKSEAKYISLAQAEREFGLDAKTLYRQIKEGALTGYKPFGKTMVKRKDLEALFQRSKTRSA